MSDTLFTESRRAFANALINRLAHPNDELAASALKDAITSAYNYGAMTQEDAIRLIHKHGLVAA